MAPVDIREATLDDVEVLLEMMEPFNVFERIPWTRASAEAPLRTLLADASPCAVVCHRRQCVSAAYPPAGGESSAYKSALDD